MIPLRDNIPSRTTPVVNYMMIGACAVAFGFQLMESGDPKKPSIVERWAMIPARVTNPDEPVRIPIAERVERLPTGGTVKCRGLSVDQAASCRVPSMKVLPSIRRVICCWPLRRRQRF